MSDPPIDRAARAERWQRVRAAMPEAALVAHDRRVRELREARLAKREADLKVRVDEAIRLALPAALSCAFTESASGVPDGPPPVPLHELPEEAWYEHRLAHWNRQLPQRTERHMTVGELIASRTDGSV